MRGKVHDDVTKDARFAKRSRSTAGARAHCCCGRKGAVPGCGAGQASVYPRRATARRLPRRPSRSGYRYTPARESSRGFAPGSHCVTDESQNRVGVVGVLLPGQQRSHPPDDEGTTATGVTQALRRRNCCGCSPANKQVGARRFRANVPCGFGRLPARRRGRRRLPHSPGKPGIGCARAETRRAVSRHCRLCKHASSSQPVRHRTAAHGRRAGVIRPSDQSVRVPGSDRTGSARQNCRIPSRLRSEQPVGRTPGMSASRDGRTVLYSQHDSTSTITIADDFQQ